MTACVWMSGSRFYVSVDPSEEAIARASQTLGNRTFSADKLRDLIEGKLVDTLRAVAARMTMDELHEKRAEFVREVSAMLEEPLARKRFDSRERFAGGNGSDAVFRSG